ncbi:MAG: GxxExxY protein [bacterium]
MKYLMKLANIKVGLLINFKVERLKESIKRFVLSNLRDLRALRGKKTV